MRQPGPQLRQPRDGAAPGRAAARAPRRRPPGGRPATRRRAGSSRSSPRLCRTAPRSPPRGCRRDTAGRRAETPVEERGTRRRPRGQGHEGVRGHAAGTCGRRAATRAPARPADGGQWAGARRARHRLRRHRHQPALRAADGLLHRQRGRPPDRGRRVRRHLDDVLVGDPHRLDQVHQRAHAGRQRRRGRRDGPDRPRAPALRRPRRQEHLAGRARHPRSLAVLRRLADHPGDQRAVRGRGRAGRRTGARPRRRAGGGGDPHRAVRRAAVRHRQGRRPVRAGDAALVRRPGRRRHRRDRGRAGCAEGALARPTRCSSWSSTRSSPSWPWGRSSW